MFFHPSDPKDHDGCDFNIPSLEMDSSLKICDQSANACDILNSIKFIRAPMKRWMSVWNWNHDPTIHQKGRFQDQYKSYQSALLLLAEEPIIGEVSKLGWDIESRKALASAFKVVHQFCDIVLRDLNSHSNCFKFHSPINV
eukprot:TRINITY_DN12974_c0_g1_i1.p2 TRINITY_DN12974_c0_g1~~TRINITY_DN12974_c0_g1_i1.p2  ORF type:complete len:141 (-),score=4.95 TRINITY_DN12974_c0_g1_i1:154-576(-)